MTGNLKGRLPGRGWSAAICSSCFRCRHPKCFGCSEVHWPVLCLLFECHLHAVHRLEQCVHNTGSQEQVWTQRERRMLSLSHNDSFISIGQFQVLPQSTMHLGSVDVAIVGAAQKAFLDTLLDCCCHIHKHLCNLRIESISSTF